MRYPTYKMLLVKSKDTRELFGSDLLYETLPARSCDFTDELWYEYLRFVCAVHARINSSESANELHTVFADYRYWQHGCNVFYIDTPLLRFVYDSNFDIDFETLKRACRLNGTSFSFAFAENASINGTKLMPLMISYNTKKEYRETVNRIEPRIETDFKYDDMISVYGRQKGGHYVYARHGCEQHVHDYLSPEMNNLDAFGGDEASMQNLHVHLRLAYGLLVFMSVFPDMVRDGFPLDMKSREVRHLKNAGASEAASHIVTLPPRFRDSPIPHFRNGHFRTLRHSRYSRNSDGTCRVIYVNAMLVGKHNVKAHTVTEEDDDAYDG